MGGFKAMQFGRNKLVFRARRTAARLTMLYKVLCVPTHDLQKGDARTRSGANYLYIRIHRARVSKEQSPLISMYAYITAETQDILYRLIQGYAARAE